MTDEKLNEAYYQPDHLWAGGKTIRKTHKMMSIPKKDVKRWLAKQVLYVPHNVFEGNTYKYILTDVDVALTYKAARAFKTKKASKVSFVLEAIYNG